MNNSPNFNNGIVASLAALEPGKLPLEIFNQVARLTVTPVVEVVPFYSDEEGKLKVLLLQREENDVLWAGMYHVPGGIVLATDAPGSFSDALQRVLDSKLETYQPTTPKIVDTQLCKVSRGTEVAIIYKVLLSTAPDDILLFDPENLPSNMIEGQAEFIQAALEQFEKS
jgi:hypothetical protein